MNSSCRMSTLSVHMMTPVFGTPSPENEETRITASISLHPHVAGIVVIAERPVGELQLEAQLAAVEFFRRPRIGHAQYGSDAMYHRIAPWQLLAACPQFSDATLKTTWKGLQ